MLGIHHQVQKLKQEETTPNILQENKTHDGIKKKIADLNQQIGVNCKRKNKALKYIKKIADSQKAQQNKGRTTPHTNVRGKYAVSLSQSIGTVIVVIVTKFYL